MKGVGGEGGGVDWRQLHLGPTECDRRSEAGRPWSGCQGDGYRWSPAISSAHAPATLPTRLTTTQSRNTAGGKSVPL